MLMITPQYWKDYKSKKEVLESFNNDEDFRVCSPIGEFSKWDNMACNKSDIKGMGVNEIKVRYKKLTETMIIKLEEE